MKLTLVCAVIGVLTSCATAGEHLVFDAGFAVSEDCVVKVNPGGAAVKFKPQFARDGECRLVTHPQTTIPSTYFIDGKYIFFIENIIRAEDGCTSEYTAIGISKAGKLFTTDRIKSSRSCFVGREVHDYEFFSPLLSAAS